MTYLNEATGFIGAVLMMLAARGFWPHLEYRGRSAAHALRMCGVMVWLTLFVRMVWWDLVRPPLGLIGLMDPARYSALGQAINTGFNLLTIIGSFYALLALLRTIPPAHRVHYNILTAPWYPKRRHMRGFPDA